jgi:hypothetical protein
VFLWCNTCLWEAKALPFDDPPWNVVGHSQDNQFQCPGCRKAVRNYVHGPSWAPGKSG